MVGEKKEVSLLQVKGQSSFSEEWQAELFSGYNCMEKGTGREFPWKLLFPSVAVFHSEHSHGYSRGLLNQGR